MKKIHYIHHTHWDREWYRSEKAFRVRLVSTIDLLIKTLEKQKELKYYVLDGQTCIIEDYLQVKPFMSSKIKQLINDNRLIIGPWYIQPDMFLVSSESIIRNLQIGINYAKSNFGSYMNVGWIPDAFGQISQTPQFFRQFGFDSIYSWRGFSTEDTKYNYFNFKAPNGDELLNIHFYLGYGFFRYLSSDEYKAKSELLDNIDKFVDRTFSDNILFTGGSDHACVQTNLVDIINKVNPLLNESGYEVQISRPELLKDEILNYVKENNFDLETFKGEAKSPKMGRIHAGISSNRQDIKSLNMYYQNLLTFVIEPLNVIMKHHNMPSNMQLIIFAWKHLLQNQFHDSIYATSPNDVNKVVKNRFLEIKQLTHELIFEALRYSRDKIKRNNKNLPLLIVNTLPLQRSGKVQVKVVRKFKNFKIFDQNNEEVKYQFVKKQLDFESADFLGILDLNSFSDASNDHKNDMYYDVVEFYVENIGGCSHVIYEVESCEDDLNNKLPKYINSCDYENNYIKLHVNANGTFNVLDKKSNALYENLNEFINKGDAGDEYNYSWPLNDKAFSSFSSKANIKCIENKLTTSFEISNELLVPVSTSSNKRSDDLVKQQIVTTISCERNSNLISVTNKVKNKSEDQILFVKFPQISQFNSHFGGDDFYFIKRPNVISDAHLWEEQKLTELPLPLYSFKNLVQVRNANNAFTIYSNSVCENYCDENNLYLTMFRSVSHLGKENLQTRPGRASGYNLLTPDSQMLGDNEQSYVIEVGELLNENYYFNNYAKIYASLLGVVHRLTNDDSEEWFWENKYFDDIKYEFSKQSELLSVDNRLSFSSLNESFNNSEADVLRLFNASSETITNGLVYTSSYNKASIVNLLDQEINNVNIEGNKISNIEVKPYSFINIKLEK